MIMPSGYLFPVKKIRDPGVPKEWRFVQDLQAVNSADRGYTFTRLCLNTMLLDMPNIDVERCGILNPATQLTTPDGTPHNWVAALQQVCTPRPDLSKTPLKFPSCFS